MRTVLTAPLPDLESHPIADAFPMMTPEETAELRQSMQRYGYLIDKPITLYEGKVLDGRNRLAVSIELGVRPRLQEFEPDVDGDPVLWVVRENLTRRHLTTAQRAMVAANIANLEWGGDRSKPQICDLPAVTQTEAAGLANVSPRSVSTARAIREADPELAAEVSAGKRSLHSAVQQIKAGAAKRKIGEPVNPLVMEDTEESITPERTEEVVAEPVAQAERAVLDTMRAYGWLLIHRPLRMREHVLERKLAEEAKALVRLKEGKERDATKSAKWFADTAKWFVERVNKSRQSGTGSEK